MRGFFVTGTDTGVGKTVAGCAIATALRRSGKTVRVMKPVETGVGAAGPLDAIALSAAAGDPDPLSDVCPLRFAMPAAPNVAARAEGREVEMDRVHAAWARISQRSGVAVVEAAGGLLAPLTDELTMADLARELALPLILVARGALGTINHTLLTLAEIDRRALPLAGVIISIGEHPLSEADAANLSFLRQLLGTRLLAEIPPLGEGSSPPGVLLDPSGWLAPGEARTQPDRYRDASSRQ